MVRFVTPPGDCLLWAVLSCSVLSGTADLHLVNLVPRWWQVRHLVQNVTELSPSSPDSSSSSAAGDRGRRQQLAARAALNAEQMWTLGKQHGCLSWQIYYCDGEVPSRLFERRAVNRPRCCVPWQAAGSVNAAPLSFPAARSSTITVTHPWNPHAKQQRLLSPLFCRKWEESRQKWGRQRSVERGTSHPTVSLRPQMTEAEQQVRGQCPYWAE